MVIRGIGTKRQGGKEAKKQKANQQRDKEAKRQFGENGGCSLNFAAPTY
jgi:hypothetical protein